MKQLEIVIHNPTGLHARPAKVLVKLAKQFQSDIKIRNGEKTANAKSMVSVLTLGASSGTNVTVMVDGEDEELPWPKSKPRSARGWGMKMSRPRQKLPKRYQFPRRRWKHR